MTIKDNAAVFSMQPMTKAQLPTESSDDRMQGNNLANEAIALAMNDGNAWRSLAFRIIGLTVEANTKNPVSANITFGIEKKHARQNMASFSVNLSKLRAVANAWNKGGTFDGWLAHANSMVSDESKHMASAAQITADAGFESLVAYARTFSESTAGRKAYTWAQKVNKWLETNKPYESSSVAEVKAYTTMAELAAKLVIVGEAAPF
jgi:hypothetical protein